MKRYFIWIKKETFFHRKFMKESGWTCLYYSDGAKDLYNYFTNKYKHTGEKFEIVTDFENHTSYNQMSYIPYNYGYYKNEFDFYYYINVYLITDEYGCIVDYDELTKPFHKKHYYKHKKHAYKKMHSKSNYSNAKKELTAKELKNIQNEYGIKIKQRHCYSWDVYDYYDCISCSKSWKDQSKRKRQYK